MWLQLRLLASHLCGIASVVCFLKGFSGGPHITDFMTAAIVLFFAWALLLPYGWLAILSVIFFPRR